MFLFLILCNKKVNAHDQKARPRLLLSALEIRSAAVRFLAMLNFMAFFCCYYIKFILYFQS